jgi:hypothetical protein
LPRSFDPGALVPPLGPARDPGDSVAGAR